MAKVSVDLKGMTPSMQNSIFVGVCEALASIDKVVETVEVVTVKAINMVGHISISGLVVLVERLHDVSRPDETEKFSGHFDIEFRKEGGEAGTFGPSLDRKVRDRVLDCIDTAIRNRHNVLGERRKRLAEALTFTSIPSQGD